MWRTKETAAIWLLLLMNGREVLSKNMTPVFTFEQLDFMFPSETIKQEAIESGSYIPVNNNPFAIELWKTKLFITVPRWLNGTGPTLNFINTDDTTNSPLLIPYPNYEINDINTGNIDDKLVSVFGVRADYYNRLWVVDSGLSEIRDRGVRLASPKLLMYDLQTDKLIKTVDLSNITRDRSIFIDLILDVDPKDPEKTFAYIADTKTFALIVYNLKQNELHRINNNFFNIDSNFGNFIYKGIKYQWPDGLTGMAVSHTYSDGFKTVYFHSLASTSEYAVSTETLQDKSKSSNFSRYVYVGDRGENGQSSSESLDLASGIIFFTLIQNNSIGCWNSYKATDYADSFIDNVADGLHYPNHLTIDFNRNIWIVENDLPKFLYANNPYPLTYKISRISVEEAVRGTICSPEIIL